MFVKIYFGRNSDGITITRIKKRKMLDNLKNTSKKYYNRAINCGRKTPGDLR